MLRLNIKDADFKDVFKRSILDVTSSDFADHLEAISQIIKDVKTKKDDLLIEHAKIFDNWVPKNKDDLIIRKDSMKWAYKKIDKDLRKALHTAFDRIYYYHSKCVDKSWSFKDKSENILGQKVTPISKAGLYIPGGKASYPSSLFMNAIPAMVANVKKVVVCTPLVNNKINIALLAAMHICKIKKAYKVGGASAIAAMAYGTDIIPKVDIITGPGNLFVAIAKKLVFGDVKIDSIAGPSEIVIIADDSISPKILSIDMLAQAEHDEMARSILITTSKSHSKDVLVYVSKYLEKLSTYNIAKVSIKNRGAIITVDKISQAIKLSNKIAPEHLQIVTKNPTSLLPKIKNAGAIFLGKYSSEVFGDYIVGPNHILPTGATARFSSALSANTFLKKNSIINLSESGFFNLRKECIKLAKIEGLSAHAKSVKLREKLFKNKN